MMNMESKTEKGLKYFNYGFLLYIIAMAVLLIILIASMGAILTLVGEDPETVDPSEIMAPLVGLFAGLCLGILIAFIALILLLVGLISIYSGRMEFGEAHASSAQKGLIFIIIGFVIGIFGGAFGTIAGPVVGIFTSLMIAFGLIYLIIEISDDSGKRMLWLAGMLYIVISIISAIVTIWLFSTYGLNDIGSGDEIAAEEAMNNAMTIIMITMGIGSLVLIPFLIFLLAYRKAYLRIKNREIQPMAPMYPAPFMGPYPPGYPSYPGYPGYPPYPPYPAPGQQPFHTPGTQSTEKIGIKPPEKESVQPVEVIESHPSEIIRCVFCGVNISKGASICPVCNKQQKT